MNKLLLVIDLQNAFINEHTKNLPNKIKEIIDNKQYDKVVFTRFIKKKDSIYVKKLAWNKCINEEEKKIVINVGENKIIDKFVYTAINKELINYIKENKIEDIYLCGIDTECCVLKTAFDLFELGYNVYVLKDYCASTLGMERHNNAIEILKRNIGKEYII